MKNFQQVLRESDREEVIQRMYDKIKYELTDSKFYEGLVIKDAISIMKHRAGKFIDKLMSMDVKPLTDDVHILYTYSFLGLDDMLAMPRTELIRLKELNEFDNDPTKLVTPYAYEFCDQSEILSYLVADTEYTKEHIMYLIEDVLYEASFFGYDEEHKKEAKEELENSVSKIEQGLAETRSWDDFKKEFGNIPRLESTDEKAVKLKQLAYEAINNYNKHTRNIELRNILKTINN